MARASIRRCESTLQAALPILSKAADASPEDLKQAEALLQRLRKTPEN